MAKGKKTGGKDFEKGVSGNPKGRPAIPIQQRAFNKLTLEEIQGYISSLKAMTYRELRAEAKQSSHDPIRVWIYKIAVQSIRTGSTQGFDTLMNRVVGKVPDFVQAKLSFEEEVRKMTDDELLEEARATVKLLEKKMEPKKETLND